MTIGANVSFGVTASGSPAPAYQWRKNGTNLAGATLASLSLTNVQAGDAGSQRRWLGQAANRNYFRDAANVERVRQWRKAHPGYWKRSKSHSKQGQSVEPEALDPATISCNASPRELVALQDFVLTDHPVFVGLLSMVTGSTLQADIAAVGRNLLLQGRTILGFESPDNPTASHDSKTIAPARPPPPSAAQFQLGGSVCARSATVILSAHS